MQSMYVGDIGDYGKCGLLRALFPADYKIGLVWYLVPDESHLNDGKHIDYLSKSKFKDCDSDLFLTLKNIISLGKRNISEIEQSNIFPNQTAFYSDYLSYEGINANSPAGRQKRLLLREEWLGNALKTVQNCDAIFLDPDNGLETPSCKKHTAKAPKYVYYDEVEKFLSITDTLIIYHHLGRTGTHASQIEQRASKLQDVAGDSYKVISLCFKPYSPRAYFIITKQNEVIEKVKQFYNSTWKKCFELFEYDIRLEQMQNRININLKGEVVMGMPKAQRSQQSITTRIKKLRNQGSLSPKDFELLDRRTHELYDLAKEANKLEEIQKIIERR